MEKKELINKGYGKNFQDHLLEQYKLYVESANKISSRRDSANHFYLTLNSALFAISGYLSLLNKQSFIYLIIPIVGIIISFNWLKTVTSYSNLNSGKFKVIHELEQSLPAKLFYYEWETIGKGKTKEYVPISNVERGVPKSFIGMYVLIIIFLLL